MAGRAQALLSGEKVPLPEGGSPSKYIERKTGRSGDDVLEEETERISVYVEKAKKIIYNKTTAKIAYDELLQDENLSNLFMNTKEKSQREFRDFLVDSLRDRNLKRISDSRMKSKAGPIIRGEIITKDVYAQTVTILGRKQVQFRDWRNGRLISIKRLRKEIL